MSTSPQTVQFVLDQLNQLKSVRVKAMFGEYALYCQEKVVGLVCDDTLFIKITPAGANILGEDYPTGRPYPVAKLHYQIDGELTDDPEQLCQLVTVTAEAVPLPQRKRYTLPKRITD